MSEKRKQKEKKRAARQNAARKQQRALVQRDADGRAHLVIQRDASGGVAALGLSRPLFDQDWQNQVTVAAASTAHGILSGGLSAERAVELGRSAMAGTSTIADGLLARSPEGRVACGSGCAHCCYQAVGVTAPEALTIYAHLRATRAPEAYAATAARIRDLDQRTRGMTSAERLSPELPCAFLEAERCSIYEVRPLACRGKNSLDAGACERSLRDPGTRAEFLAGRFTVPCFVEPLRAFHAVTAGLQLALDELHGLKVTPLELTAAMRVVIDDPDVTARRWLAGEDPFAPAQGADGSRNDRVGALVGWRRADG